MDKNEIAITSTTNLGSWTNWALKEVQSDFSAGMIEFDDYSKKCAMDAMSAIYQLIQNTDKADIGNMDTSNLRDIIKRCASLKLSASSYPREVYFQLRNKQVNGQWVKEVEMGIEGDGNDSLLRNFGVGVQKVYPVWLVKEGDEFTYPKRVGLSVTPPEWEEKGLSSKVVRVVYPVKLTGKDVEYLIAERDSVKTNLMAHVRNNLLNETFGICESRYKAKPEQLQQIKAKKDEIIDALRNCATVDDMLACELARPYISAAWLDSPESMIVRKMRNNAIKKYPKNFNSIANNSYVELDETYKTARQEIEENEMSQPFLIEENEE